MVSRLVISRNTRTPIQTSSIHGIQGLIDFLNDAYRDGYHAKHPSSTQEVFVENNEKAIAQFRSKAASQRAKAKTNPGIEVWTEVPIKEHRAVQCGFATYVNVKAELGTKAVGGSVIYGQAKALVALYGVIAAKGKSGICEEIKDKDGTVTGTINYAETMADFGKRSYAFYNLFRSFEDAKANEFGTIAEFLRFQQDKNQLDELGTPKYTKLRWTFMFPALYFARHFMVKDANGDYIYDLSWMNDATKSAGFRDVFASLYTADTSMDSVTKDSGIYEQLAKALLTLAS